MLLTDSIVAAPAAGAEPIASVAVIASSASGKHKLATDDGSPSVARQPSSISRRLVASFGALRPAGVGVDVFLRLGLDQRHHIVLDGLDPIGRLRPFGAVQFRQVDAVVPVVIGY